MVLRFDLASRLHCLVEIQTGRHAFGKAERGEGATKVIAEHKVAYLMAVGGAAYLVARAIKESKVVGFEDLGMEAIYEFRVKDMPVTVAVDAAGNNVHQLAPLVWKERIAREGLLGKA